MLSTISSYRSIATTPTPWPELVQGVVAAARVTTFEDSAPHITLVAHAGLAAPAVRRAIAHIAATTDPFTVHAHGYGFFTGSEPSDLSLHVPVARTPALNELHRRRCAARRRAGATSRNGARRPRGRPTSHCSTPAPVRGRSSPPVRPATALTGPDASEVNRQTGRWRPAPRQGAGRRVAHPPAGDRSSCCPTSRGCSATSCGSPRPTTPIPPCRRVSSPSMARRSGRATRPSSRPSWPECLHAWPRRFHGAGHVRRVDPPVAGAARPAPRRRHAVRRPTTLAPAHRWTRRPSSCLDRRPDGCLGEGRATPADLPKVPTGVVPPTYVRWSRRRRSARRAA